MCMKCLGFFFFFPRIFYYFFLFKTEILIFFKWRQLIVNDLHSSTTFVVSVAVYVCLPVMICVCTDIIVIVVSEREIA